MKRLVVIIFATVFALIFATYSYAKSGEGKGSATSQAVHQAQSEGLKGKEVAGAAHEAIEEKKETFVEMMNEVVGTEVQAEFGTSIDASPYAYFREGKNAYIFCSLDRKSVV